ncbi:Uncharacterised protein [Mycobacteroides abscessus]|nr:Uncharacterised protein [Mycobacteroides abscessus]
MLTIGDFPVAEEVLRNRAGAFYCHHRKFGSLGNHSIGSVRGFAEMPDSG